MEGNLRAHEPAAPAALAPHERELSVPGQFLTRLLGLATLAALGLLALVAWRVASASDDFDMTGLTIPMLLVGLFWLATFVVATWMVRLEWSGTSLLLVCAALGGVGFVLGRAVPPGSERSPMYFGLGAGELAVELQFSLICAAVGFVIWAVWATMPVARRTWPRPTIAVLGVAVVLVILFAWASVPSYPSGFVD